MNTRGKGFTLLEVLISTLLILIGIAALGVCVVAGKHFLKQTDLRAQAVNIASSRMREYLARDYSMVSDTVGQEGDFNWTVTVTSNTTTGGSRADIPYKEIEVVTFYEVENDGEIETKNIRLTNILPYPTVHNDMVDLVTDANAKVPWACASAICSSSCGADEEARFACADTIGSGGNLLSKEVTYNTTKNIEVSYTISVAVTDPDGEIQPTDTIYTACFLDGVLQGMVARTPIKSQLSYSNRIVLENVERDKPHTIELKWYYGSYYADDDGVEYDQEYDNVTMHLGSGVLAIKAAELEE